MKKRLSFLAAFTAILLSPIFTSCNSDDDTIDVTSHPAERYESAATLTSTHQETLCKTWKPINHHAYIYAEGRILYNKEKASFVELQKDLVQYIKYRPAKDSDLFFNEDFSSFQFLSDNRLLISFDKDNKQTAVWNWEENNTDICVRNATGQSTNENILFKGRTKWSGNKLHFFFNVDITNTNLKDRDIECKIVTTFIQE